MVIYILSFFAIVTLAVWTQRNAPIMPGRFLPTREEGCGSAMYTIHNPAESSN
jgi:hypothetical protein